MKVNLVFFFLFLISFNLYAAMNFDGSNERIGFGSIYNTLGDRTICAWIYLDSVSADGTIISKWDNNTSNDDDFLLFFDDAVGVNSNAPDRISYTVSNDSSSANWIWISSSQLSVSTWYFVAITHDIGISCNMYINGVLDNDYTQNTIDSVTISTDNMYIADTTDLNRQFNGKISNVMIFNTAFTVEEIRLIYESGQKLFIPPNRQPNLVGYWILDGSDNKSANGDTIIDLSGNGNDGTSIGGTWKAEEFLTYP